MDIPFAEDVNFWKSSSTSPDAWIAKAAKQIRTLGGRVTGEGFGSDGSRAAYMLQFEIESDIFRMTWPVLPSKTNDVRAARIQAATALYHFVKMTCLAAVTMGPRTAFFAFLMLPDGRTAAQLGTPELAARWPKLLQGG